MSDIRELDISTMSWGEIRDLSQFVAMSSMFFTDIELLEIIDYLRQNKLLVLKNTVFYYFVFKYFLRTLRYVYGYGLITSIQHLYFYISKTIFQRIMNLSFVKKKVDVEVTKVVNEIENVLVVKDSNLRYFQELPSKGLSPEEIFSEFDKYDELKHNDWENGKVSGAVYHGGKELIKLQTEAFERYCVSNQLHPDSFPGLRKMESEVVSMCLRLFNAPETGCGTSSSGGTESLILTCLSAKVFGKKFKGITEPEIIAPISIHAGIDKACYYFGIKLFKVPLTKDYKLDTSYVKRLISGNTILIIGSAPNFPYGTIDDIETLSNLGVKYNIPVHVDCCLGSFIVSFMERTGLADENFPKFDFRLPGVTSISCDTHKYGFAPKGSSIIMYRNQELRSCQYFIINDWVGGLYGSPTLSGSRPGAIMAGCWTTMVHIGEEGYKKACRGIVGAAQEFKRAIIKDIPELIILGDPILSVVSFKSNIINIYDLSDNMSKKGWHLSALQNPPALHVAFTMLSANKVDILLNDLKKTIKILKESGSTTATGDTAQLYGTAGSISTSGVVNRLIEGFIDTLYKT